MITSGQARCIFKVGSAKTEPRVLLTQPWVVEEGDADSVLNANRRRRQQRRSDRLEGSPLRWQGTTVCDQLAGIGVAAITRQSGAADQ